jgi:hypothetical protein
VFTEPLPSNGRFFWLHYSGFQASFLIVFESFEGEYAEIMVIFFQNKESRLEKLPTDRAKEK